MGEAQDGRCFVSGLWCPCLLPWHTQTPTVPSYLGVWLLYPLSFMPVRGAVMQIAIRAHTETSAPFWTHAAESDKVSSIHRSTQSAPYAFLFLYDLLCLLIYLFNVCLFILCELPLHRGHALCFWFTLITIESEMNFAHCHHPVVSSGISSSSIRWHWWINVMHFAEVIISRGLSDSIYRTVCKSLKHIKYFLIL